MFNKKDKRFQILQKLILKFLKESEKKINFAHLCYLQN